MQTYGAIIPGSAAIAHLLPQGTAAIAAKQAEAAAEARLSREGRRRLKAVRWCEEHGHNVSRTAPHFGYSRVTIHNWLRRYRHVALDYLTLQEYITESRQGRPGKEVVYSIT